MRALRGADGPVPFPFTMRLVPAVLIAASGADTAIAYLVIDIVAGLIAAALLYRLFLRYSRERPVLALLGVAWWAMTPTAIRLSLYYPVLNDALGFALFVALVVTALERRVLLFGGTLVAAVLTREVSIIAIPFAWLSLRSSHAPWPLATTVAASAPALAALAFVFLAGPVTPSGSTARAMDLLAETAIDRNAAFQRYVSALPMTLGVFLAVPLARWRSSVAFLRREPAWAYLAAAVLVVALLGDDRDRYFLWLVPPLGACAVYALGRLERPRRWTFYAILTALHAIAVRFAWPLGSDEREYLQSTTGFMARDLLTAYTVIAVGACWLAFRLVGAGSRRGRAGG